MPFPGIKQQATLVTGDVALGGEFAQSSGHQSVVQPDAASSAPDTVGARAQARLPKSGSRIAYDAALRPLSGGVADRRLPSRLCFAAEPNVTIWSR
jgi:hypothetical protein